MTSSAVCFVGRIWTQSSLHLAIESEIAPWDPDENQTARTRLIDELHALPRPIQGHLLAKFQLMIETIVDMNGGRERPAPAPLQERRHSADW